MKNINAWFVVSLATATVAVLVATAAFVRAGIDLCATEPPDKGPIYRQPQSVIYRQPKSVPVFHVDATGTERECLTPKEIKERCGEPPK